ncbi:hypothetical protein [Methylocystis sp.]
MTVGDKDPAFSQLTAMLHWKKETSNLKISDLDAIYNNLCNENGASSNKDALVYDVIFEQAKECSAVTATGLTNKIVLAIAIRLRAEKFMVERIADPDFVASIEANQAWRLVSKFKDLYPKETLNIAALDKVALMTPENIHVNAFMYEPIIDMSDDNLRRLYERVKELK